MLHKLLLVSSCLLFVISNAFTQVNPADVTIVRDKWGVPHIYGKTDADASYGLAWAHCEDDFENVQAALLAMKGRLSEVDGISGAILDVGVFVLNADKIVEEQFEAAFSPEFRKVLTGHVQGINDYAAAHPEEIKKKGIFPTNEKEIIKGYVLAQGLLSNALFGIARLIDDKHVAAASSFQPQGSNAWAYAPKKMKEGHAALISNTHQPLHGPVSWYEAHVVSEEGWNMLGGTFSAGVTLFLGTNEHLGWTHTTNYPDFHDVFELKMHPTKKNFYQFDGEWLELEERKIKLKVKIGPFKIPVSRKFYWSKYGTTIKNKSGYFSVRFPGQFDIRAAEQWFHMNKAKNFEEFQEALDMQGLVSQNIIYADNTGNIFFRCNGLFPERNPDYDWLNIVPGDTSATLWEPRFMPIEALPEITNPECGYLYNCNNTPFTATDPAEDLNGKDFNQTMGFSKEQTNRSLRFQELIDQYGEQLSYEDIKAIKYDEQYAKTMYTKGLENFDVILKLDPQKYPDLAEILERAKKWDRKTNKESTEATVFCVATSYLIKLIADDVRMDLANTLPEEEYVNALRYAKKFLNKHYGTLDVPLGSVQKHVKGDVELPVGGMPEILCAMYVVPNDKKTFKSDMGESYIQFVQYTDEGVKIESVHPFGASNRPESPHYTDQMELYTNRKMKEMTLDKKTIMKNAVEVYSPGKRN